MRVRVDNTRLFFDVEGAVLALDGPDMRERPTIVTVHGGPGADHTQFRPFLSPLADAAQLVHLDLRGHGRSDESASTTWRLATWADDVHAFCDALGIERPIVLGASFGSLVALTYAGRHPGRAGGLVLVAAAARFDRMVIGAAFEELGGAPARAVAERFLADPTEASQLAYRRVCRRLYAIAPTGPQRGAPAVDRPEIARHFFAGEARTLDLRATVSAIRCPVLVVNGERDPIMPVAAAAELSGAFQPGVATAVTIPGASHDLAHDAPDVVVGLVRLWLQDVPTLV